VDRTLSASVTAATLIFLVLLFWGVQGHREASRSGLRADSLATEILIERARADGWEAVAADTAAQLLELLAASDSQGARLSREIEALRARPVSRTVVVASSEGDSEAIRDPEASSPDSTIYRVDDGPLSAAITAWSDSVLSRLHIDWHLEISAELFHVEAPDRRLLVFARSPDPRVRLSVPTFEYQLPVIERPRLPWRWIGAALAGGYLLGRVF